MTSEDLDKLAKFTDAATALMRAMEVRQNIAGNSEIVFETSHRGEKIVAKFLMAAPINISCLLGEVRDLHEFIMKVLHRSMEDDCAEEGRVSDVTKMLKDFVDSRKSVVITTDPKVLMDGGADA